MDDLTHRLIDFLESRFRNEVREWQAKGCILASWLESTLVGKFTLVIYNDFTSCIILVICQHLMGTLNCQIILLIT